MNKVFSFLRGYSGFSPHWITPRQNPGGHLTDRNRIWGLMGWLILALFGLAACSSAPDVPPPTATPDRPPRIAFMSNRDGNFDVFLMDKDGGNLVNLTNAPAQDGVPAYSQPARSFAFLTDRNTGELAIYRMGEAGEIPALLATDPTPSANRPYWSPNGKFIAYHSGETSELDIFLIDAGTNTVQALVEGSGNDQFEAWSPDGRKALVTSNREGSPAIYVVNVEDGEMSRLTDPLVGSAFPVWSPDGSKIAFASDQDDDVEIYLMDPDGEKLTRLTDSVGFDGYPKWSPDGSQIAFVSNRDDNPEIYVMNADGGEQVNLTNLRSSDSVDGDFDWSPDGSQILFTSDRDGDMEVYVMNADGANPINLTAFPSGDIAPIWVP